jgi:DNA polymerase-3 subunit delta
MFAPHQILLIKGIGKIRENQAAGLIEYFENPSPFTTLVFLAEELDRDEKKKKIFQLLEKWTYVAELASPKENEVKSWVASKLKTAGLNVEPGAIDFLIETQGTDLGRISNEVEKVCLLAGAGKQVTLAMVTESVGFSREHTVFEFLNAIADRNKSQALRLIPEMLADSQQALGMLALLARQLRQWLQVKELAGKKRPDEIARQIGVFPIGRINQVISQSRQFSHSTLVQGLYRLGMVDDRIKRSALDTRIFVELLVHDLTR